MTNCSPKFSFSFKNKPRWFWYGICITWLLLKINTGWLGFLIVQEKITSSTCLEGSGLKPIFHWYSQFLIFSRSLFKTLADKFVSRTAKNREVSSAKSLGFDDSSYLVKHYCWLQTIKEQRLNLVELLH